MTLFVKAARPTFTAPVEISVAGEGDDGVPEKHTVVMEFRRLKRTELAEFLKRETHDMDAIKQMVTGWRNLPDGQGGTVPFTPEHLDALFEIPWAPQAILNTIVNQGMGASRKN